MSEKTTVEVTVLDQEGNTLGSFEANDHESFLDVAEKIGIDIPFSCRTGACFACACTVKEGMNHVDLGLLGMPLVDVEDDQCLSCIAGVKKQVFSQPGFHRIVLQKLM